MATHERPQVCRSQDTASPIGRLPGDRGKLTLPTKTSGQMRRRKIGFLCPPIRTLEKARKPPPLTSGQKFKTGGASASFDYIQFLCTHAGPA